MLETALTQLCKLLIQVNEELMLETFNLPMSRKVFLVHFKALANWKQTLQETAVGSIWKLTPAQEFKEINLATIERVESTLPKQGTEKDLARLVHILLTFYIRKGQSHIFHLCKPARFVVVLKDPFLRCMVCVV